MARAHHKIDYVELPAMNMAASKAFYTRAFGWAFEDYGPDYAAFVDAGLDGGLYRAAEPAPRGAAVVILYSDDLAASQAVVEEAGSTAFGHVDFPGGRRFHFLDPGGNELAIWTPADAAP